MKRYVFLIAILLTAAITFGVTQALSKPDEIMPSDPAELLGLNPSEIISKFGPPQKVLSVRGFEAWQDDVVFDYEKGFSFFLFVDKVWQIRIARPYIVPVLGIVIGLSQDRAVSIFGTPYRTENSMLEWVLPGEAWPVHLRALLDDKNLIQELYIYRADF